MKRAVPSFSPEFVLVGGPPAAIMTASSEQVWRTAMRGYGQFCPVAKGAEVFAERWTPLVLRELLCGSTQFSDLHRGVPLMSRSLLSLRLKQLEQIGVVERKRGPQGPQYHLTQAGREFAPIVRQLGEWGAGSAPGTCAMSSTSPC